MSEQSKGAPVTLLGPTRRNLLQGSLATVGTVAGLGLLGGCGQSDAGAGGGKKTIGVSLNGLVEYTKQVAEGVAKAFDGGDYELKIVQANFDVQTEVRNIGGLVSQGVDGLVILPNTIDAVLTAVRDAHDSGIKTGLALWAKAGPLDKFVTGVAEVDSVAGGKMVGEWLKKNGKPGKVIVVQGVVGQGFSERIDDGLNASLKGTDFDIVVREQGFFDRNKAIAVVERALQAHPDATTIVSYAAAMGDGIASYLKQNKIENITHVSSDADKELLTWLGTPYMAASRYYSAAETGLIAGEAVRASLEGKKPTFKKAVYQAIMEKGNSAAVLKKEPMSYPQFEDKLTGL